MGGLHGAGKEVVKAVFARCTAPLLPSACPAAVGALRQGLSVQLGRSMARQLEALMIVSTEAPAWWAVMGRGDPDPGTLRRDPTHHVSISTCCRRLPIGPSY